MRSALREMRRAPLRVAASTLAIALAIAAMGIFAIPSMASNTLRDIAAADLAAHLQLTTTPFDATTLRAEIEQMDGVEAVELGTTGTVTFGSGGTGGEGVRVESYPESSSVNRIRLGEGRMPRDAGEVLGGFEQEATGANRLLGQTVGARVLLAREDPVEGDGQV